MKFYGHGVVWDASKSKPLCRFDENGELVVFSKYIIERLLQFGYRYDEPNNALQTYTYTDAELAILKELEDAKQPEEHLFVIEGSLPDERVAEIQKVIKNEHAKTNTNSGTPKRTNNRRAHNDRK